MHMGKNQFSLRKVSLGVQAVFFVEIVRLQFQLPPSLCLAGRVADTRSLIRFATLSCGSFESLEPLGLARRFFGRTFRSLGRRKVDFPVEEELKKRITVAKN